MALCYSFLSLSQAVVFRKYGQRGKVKLVASQSTAMPSAAMGKLFFLHVLGGS